MFFIFILASTSGQKFLILQANPHHKRGYKRLIRMHILYHTPSRLSSVFLDLIGKLLGFSWQVWRSDNADMKRLDF
jgi:hypothetical protein